MPPYINLQRQSFDAVPPGSPLPLSLEVEEQMSTLLNSGASIFLFLNRLGIARELKCYACTFSMKWDVSIVACSRCGSENISEIAIGVDGLLERCRLRWPDTMIAVSTSHQRLEDQWILQTHLPYGRILIATRHALQDRRLNTIPWSLVVALGVDALRAHPSPTAALETLQLLVEVSERFARPTASPVFIMTHTPELSLWDAIADLSFRKRWYAEELMIYRSVGILEERIITIQTESDSARRSAQTFLNELLHSPAAQAKVLSTIERPLELKVKIPSTLLSSSAFQRSIRALRGQWTVTMTPVP